MKSLGSTIENCQKCRRLRDHCLKIGRVKRRAYQDETYWTKPIRGFGDPKAELFIVGLAPGAHGANRTGRVFTGDRSGLWLYRALYRAGFSSQESSENRTDALRLKNAYISCVVKCAPPENKPTRNEISNCSRFLESELAQLKRTKVFLVLGGVALQGIWPHIGDRPRPKFGHGTRAELADGRWVICSYHPSQQNTFTGRLTEPMFDGVFKEARKLLGN